MPLKERKRCASKEKNFPLEKKTTGGRLAPLFCPSSPPPPHTHRARAGAEKENLFSSSPGTWICYGRWGREKHLISSGTAWVCLSLRLDYVNPNLKLGKQLSAEEWRVRRGGKCGALQGTLADGYWCCTQRTYLHFPDHTRDYYCKNTFPFTS